MKKWSFVFLATCLITILFVFAINAVVDPYGVFGDNVIQWYSYNMCNNPRIGKTTYLDKYYKNYDSYIIGGSKSSALSPELLNNYYDGARFYNYMIYGGDFYDYEKIALYIINNYDVKNIVLHMSTRELNDYKQVRSLNNALPSKIDGSSDFFYYMKYLSLDLKHSIQKLEGLIRRNYDPLEYGYIIPESGIYDKSQRDAEFKDVTIDEYLQANKEFSEPLSEYYTGQGDKVIQSLKTIKDECDKRDITFLFIIGATYEKEMQRYNKDRFTHFLKNAAMVTDFWDFSGFTEIGHDPRNFYDPTHYKYSVGKIMLAKIFNDRSIIDSQPYNEDFGIYVTKDNVDDYIKNRKWQYEPRTVQVPILTYHHLDSNEHNLSDATVTPKKFEEDMIALKSEGYMALSFKQLIDYQKLPNKPIIITFDDGYESNYKYAYPILKKLGMCATINIIGWSVGRDTYKDTSEEIIPHFDWKQAKEMYDSDVIDIQCHTYDLHEDGSSPPFTRGITKNENESLEQYESRLNNDFSKIKNLIETNVGNDVFVFAYPYGESTVISNNILKELDFKITLSTEKGINHLTRDSSLFNLKRINVAETPVIDILSRYD